MTKIGVKLGKASWGLASARHPKTGLARGSLGQARPRRFNDIAFSKQLNLLAIKLGAFCSLRDASVNLHAPDIVIACAQQGWLAVAALLPIV